MSDSEEISEMIIESDLESPVKTVKGKKMKEPTTPVPK